MSAKKKEKDLFDAAKSEEGKKKALELVSNNNFKWMESIYHYIEALPKGWTGTGEDIRRTATVANHPLPKVPNAWGAAVSFAIRRKLIEPTGRRLKMKTTTSNARKTDEYRRI